MPKKKHGSQLIEMTADEWIDTYDPKMSPEGTVLYETYGEDFAEVIKAHRKNPLQVWTLVQGDSGGLWVIEGYHLVNRLNYLITRKSAKKGAAYSVVWD